jgi:hypothetical protein
MALNYKEDADQKAVQDEKYNPATRQLNNTEEQGTFDDDFDSLTNPDHMAQDGKPGDLAGGAREAEKKPQSNGYTNNYTGAQKKALQSVNKLQMLRKKGPLATIITLVLGGGLGFSALFSPGLLIVQMKEVMVDKFNTQLASMDVRTEKIITKKITGATSGICTPVTIRCKYSTMSEDQVAKFKAAGIDVEGDAISKGRIKPTKLTLKGGLSVEPKDFSSTYRSNSTFKSAVNNAYNPKFNGFSDSVWDKFARRIGISKKPKVTGETDAERAANLDEATTNGDKASTVKVPKQGETNPDTGKPYSAADIAELEKAAIAAEEIAVEAGTGVKAGTQAVGEVANAVENGAASAGNFFKLTGVADNVCQAYGAVQTLGYAAKTVRAVQLARYAMAFLNLADEIKAGNSPSPGDVAYMGGILTNIAYDAGSAAKKVSRGSATDSFGYKYAAYGETGKMSNFTMQFLAGGGLTGDLINITSSIKQALIPFGGPQACKTLANPWVQAGSIVGGIGLMLIPGVGQMAFSAKTVLQAGTQIAFSAAMILLPNLLKDVVAGNVTKGISGADAGDAYSSGSGGMMSGLANAGGNSAMTKADALAYNDLQTQTVAYYNKLDAAKLSPMDATSRYTFMGSIVSSLMPYYSRLGSFGGIATSIGSIVSNSFASIIPKSSAVSNQQYSDALDKCQDYDYQQLGIATDPFCNVIYGIAPKYLNKDPDTVMNELAGQIDPVSGEPIGAYKEFADKCIARKSPLGGSSVSTPEGDGSECVMKDSNANYYLHYVDQRIMAQMGDTTQDVATSSTVPTAVDTTQVHSDSSSIACDPRTTDGGIQDGYYQKVLVKIHICQVPELGVAVNSRISKNTADMITSMKASGVLDGATSGFRTMAAQTGLYNSYLTRNGNLASVPGTSNHQMGLAIDFKMIGGTSNSQNKCVTVNGLCTISGDATYDWLKTNAISYGFTQDKSEFWHWEVQ